MKTYLILFLLVLAMAVPSFAAPVCTTTTLSALLTSGFSCEAADKVFSGFTYAGDIAASNIQVTFQSGGTPAFASIFFIPTNGEGWTSLRDLSWTTNIDTNICSNCEFAAVLDQITTTSAFVNFTHDGSLHVNLSPFPNLSGQVSLTGTSLTTSVTQTAGYLNSVKSSVSQVEVVPEPSSLLLLGSGLAGFAGMIRRKLKL